MSDLCPGPRVPTGKPKLITPKGTCDCHFHIFGDSKDYPYVAERAYTPPVASNADYLQMAGALGIERMVVVQASVHGYDNSCTVAAIRDFGLDRARGIAAIRSDVSDAELRRLHEAGIRGVRFITLAAGGAPLSDLKSIAARIAPLGWHIQMYVHSQTWAELEATILDLPVEVVIDHMGQVGADAGPNDPGLLSILRLLESGRAWIKLCGYRASKAGTPYADVAWLARTYVAHRIDRCVWGSDWPHPHMPTSFVPDDADLLDLLLDWTQTDEQRQRILADNPAQLYGFSNR